MTTEARPDLEARVRREACQFILNCGARKHSSACDRLTALLLEHAREREALQRERDDAEGETAKVRMELLNTVATLNGGIEAWVVQRAETVLADLAALRRRVEEAASGDDKRTARVRATEVIMVGDVGHLLSVIDAQRVAAGELRGMLREAHSTPPEELHAFWSRPDVLAAIKEPTK